MMVMRKQEFLAQLDKKLSGLPQKDKEERLAFYGEMIDDRMEEGLPEEEAVAGIGGVEEIVYQMTGERPPVEKTQPKKEIDRWALVLLIIGAPVWFPLGISVVSVVFSVYISWWAVIVSAWAVFGSLIAAAVGALITGIVFLCTGQMMPGVAMLAGSMICAGLSVFAFFGCRAVTKGTAWLTQKAALWIKGCFVRKEEAK
jgi:uncharacterized membrane protein